jgi:hypothetical protein
MDEDGPRPVPAQRTARIRAMRRTLLAALLAIPLLLAWGVPSFAHYPQQCSFGHGCGGWCLGLCSKMHQHGPLFNYGPYYGYPPFEPYGPWNAYLQYNPWYYGNGGGHGWGHGGLFHGHGKCLGCGLHAHFLHGGWFHGHACLHCGHGGGWLAGLKCKSCGHGHLLGHKGGCSTCQANITTAAFDPAKTDAVARYAGAGSPEEFTAFYAQLPSLQPTAAGY